MSNGINSNNDPNRLNASQFNQQKQSKPDTGSQRDEEQAPAPQAQERPSVDPDRMMAMMAQIGAMNAGNVENVALNRSIDQSLNTFFDSVTPETHAKLYETFEKAFQAEFGITPGAHLVQEALDNFLIGSPVIQA